MRALESETRCWLHVQHQSTPRGRRCGRAPGRTRAAIAEVFLELTSWWLSILCPTAGDIRANEPAPQTMKSYCGSRSQVPRFGRPRRTRGRGGTLGSVPMGSRAESKPSAEEDLVGGAVIERPLGGLHPIPGAGEQAQPGPSREQPLDMAVVRGGHHLAVAEQESVLGDEGVVGRVRVPGPLEAAERAGSVLIGDQIGVLRERP